MSDSIQVAIKVRPLIKREKDDNLHIQWAVVDNAIIPLDPEKKKGGENGFQFDHIFDSEKTNADVFEIVVKPIVDAAVNGFNGTVFAYGQTSSGKTHTMMGTPSEPGIIPMAVERMFDSIAETDGREFLLRVSYLEIYNEKVNDLLDTTGIDLKLREDSNGLVQVLKSKEEIASSPDVIMAIMKKGDKNRRIGETDMNEKSSRSHSIFRITIESRDVSTDSDGAVQVSQLNLVDLAGSERGKQTNATGERFKEGTHINMSLSTLGLVIKQLSESSDSTKYVNFRDSKLTRLLQASLGGNAMTTIICAVTPAAIEETQCTLWFASRAKSVKNKPQLNEVMSDAALLKRYKKQLAKLNEELERLKHESRVPEVQEMESKLQEKEHKLQEIDRMNQILEERIQLLKNGIISAGSATRDDINSKIPRSKRRRTWAGDRALSSQFSLCDRNLPTIQEVSCTSPDSKSNHTQCFSKSKGRKSIIQTVDLDDESFETAFTDFELELIKVAKEREEDKDFTLDCTEEKYTHKLNPRSENRVKFQDNVEIYRLSSGSNWSEASTTPEKQTSFSSPGDRTQDSSGSPDTPKAILRERLTYLAEEYRTLQEFTTLERQILSAQNNEFESTTEKIFMQKTIDELLERLKKFNTYQAELEEQLTVSLNCIEGLSLYTPDILKLWNPSLFSDEKGEMDTFSELKHLHELLKNLKNEQNSGEKTLTELEKKLTNDYNECLRKLEQVQSEKELLFKENTEIKKKLNDESNKLKNTNTQINTLRTDTDCLMEKLIQKNNELAKLKERVVDLEKLIEMSKPTSLETSTKPESDAVMSSNSNSDTDKYEDKDAEILKLNEIVKEKMTEIIKYRQFEEEMKMENERLQQSLDAISKVEQECKESQTEKISIYEPFNENNVIDSNKSKDNEISELSEFIHEKTVSMEEYQQLEAEMKKKIEELEQCIVNVEKVSQECQTDLILDCNTENNLILNQNKDEEISKLLKLVEENAISLANYKQVEEQLKEEIASLSASQQSKECQGNDDNKMQVDLEKDNELFRLEEIIQEKTLEITKYQTSEKELRKEIERLQLCLDNTNKIEKISQECQTENLRNDSDIKNIITADLYEDKNNEISGLLEVIQLKSAEIESYRHSTEEMKKEIEQLQQFLENVEKVEQKSEECKTEHLPETDKDTDTNQEKDNEISKLLEIIQENVLDVEKYKVAGDETKKEIEMLQKRINDVKRVELVSTECQTECTSDDNNESYQDNLRQEKHNEICRQSKIIEEISIELEKYKQKENEMKKEIEQLQQSLNNVKKVEKISAENQTESSNSKEEENNEIFQSVDIIVEKKVGKKVSLSQECQTECISNVEESDKIDINVETDNEIARLSDIIQEKTSKIDSYKQLEEELRKEIEGLQQHLETAVNTEKVSQENQTEEELIYDDNKIAKELEMSNQIKVYQEEIEALKKYMAISQEDSVVTSAELEIKITSLNEELTSKIKCIEELSSLNSALKGAIDEKTNEFSNLQQVMEMSIKELEQQIDTIVLERNELKEKIDSVNTNNLAQDFEKEAANLKELFEKLKTENEHLKQQIQELEIELNKTKLSITVHETSISLTTPSKPSVIASEDNINIYLKSQIVKEEDIKPSVSVVFTNQDASVLTDADSFVKPANVLKEECKVPMPAPAESKIPVASNNKSCAKSFNKNFELETSSMLANMTYFDNMEVSQSFAPDCTTLLTGIDETKDISNMSANVNTFQDNDVKQNKSTVNAIVLCETNKDGSNSENVEASSIVMTKNEPTTLEDLTKAKVYLEKENARLAFELQKKIQETEEVQKVVSDFKLTLEELQQTIYILTNENMDMSRQLTETRESNNLIVNNFQKEIDALTARLSAITEEKLSLKSELMVLKEDFDNMRTSTPTITDDEIKRKIFEYDEKIKALTDENIVLSTDLMDKIEELEKVKESKVQMYDHECIYKEKSESLIEKIERLEKENIELSSELTEQIEECDKLKETTDVLQQQLEAYTKQHSSESSDKDVDLFKQENSRLTSELIELRAKVTQLTRENVNLSSNLTLNNSDEHNGPESANPCNTSSAQQISVLEESSNESNNVSYLNKQIKCLQEQVEHLTLLNKKLGELKLTNCSQCAHLKELNESRRELKLEVKSLNQKLSELQKKFEQKCADTEVLRTKANEDINTSLSLIDSTFNSSAYDGLSVTVIEEKVQNLHSEIEELKENHNKLSNQYKEKCNELEKLQLDNNSLASPAEKKETRRSKSDSTRKTNLRIQALQKAVENLSSDLQELKKHNANVGNKLSKFIAERAETMQTIESLKLLNEELKRESDYAKANASNYEEKVKLLEEELTNLYKRVETVTTREKEIQAQKLEVEVQFETLLKEKTEFASSLQSIEEKFRKELEDYNARVHNYEKENLNLKNELQKFEDIMQKLKTKNENHLQDKLQEEIDFAKSRIIKEIKGLSNLSEDELKALPRKSVTDLFLNFLNAILSKEREIVKSLQEDFEKSKRRLEEEKQQSFDAEKRANVWAKTLETDLEKLQADLTEQEHKNRRLLDEVHRLEENLKEAHHENQQLHTNISNLEVDLNSLHNELDKKLKSNSHRDSVIIAAQEKEKLARTIEEEWENRLKLEKEEHTRELMELNEQLESCKSTNDDLKSSVEGLELEMEHLRNTIDIKTTDFTASVRKNEELQREIEYIEEINKQLKNENEEKNKNIDEITNLLKTKCDLLTEYKTKVETMKPEYENLQLQISERKALIEKYKDDIHNLKLENKKQLDTLQDKLSSEEIKSAALNKQLAEYKNKNTALSSTIEELKDRCAELERDNSNLQRKVRNSTSKIRVESEIQEMQDENRSLKNHLEGSYNRIKELQESKSQIQRELMEAQGKNEVLEQDLNTAKIAYKSIREKYDNVNLQNLREKYELSLREKNSIILEVEEKKMLLANKDQKLVEYGIEIDTLRKQKEMLDKEIENIRREKSLLENKISELITDSEEKRKRMEDCNADKNEAYKLIVDEKNKISLELENCRKKMSELVIKNKELDDELEDLVSHIHKQEDEIAELQDRLITGLFDVENVQKLKNLEEDNEKLKIDLRVSEVHQNKLQNEIIRLNSEKELFLSRIEDLNGKIGELELKNASRSSSKSNSPTTQKGRRRRRRSDLYNQNRNLEFDSDSKDITDTDSPSITPIPPPIIDEECHTCLELRKSLREMSLDVVSRNNKITMLEVQLQKENFPYQMKCNELQENLLAFKTRNSELKLEMRKLQRALNEDSSRECHICRQRKCNKRDQAVQVRLENKVSLTGMSSGIVEDYLRLEKMEKERNWMKDLCRNRARKIKELEQRIKEIEGLNTT